MVERLISDKAEIREHVTCSMCKNIFTRPQELACLHVFCERCLKTLPRVESKNNHGFHCPTCKTFSIMGEEKTPNMKNEFVKAFTSGERKCGTCGKDSAVWHCEDCDYIMCDVCKMHHSKMLQSAGHVVVSSDRTQGLQFVINKPILCEVHADQFVKFYCTICQELICSNCFTEKHVHKANVVRKLADAAESFVPEIRQKIALIEGKNKILQDQVSTLESQMNEVREGFDGARVELDQTKKIVMQNINAQYDRDVKLLEESKNQEIAKLRELKEKNEYNIAENNSLVSFTKIILQNVKSGSLVKEFTRGLGRRIDEAVSKKIQDNSKNIKFPRLKQNATIMGDENILGKFLWDHDTKRIRRANDEKGKKKIISFLSITGIMAVILAVFMFYMLHTKQGGHIHSDFRHVNQSISEVLNRLSPTGTDIYAKGLFVLNATGKIQYRVAEGQYYDVSKHDDKVIALEWISAEKIRLHNIKYYSGKWNSDEEAITIDKISVSYGHVTMAVYGDSVNISTWSYNKIYKYTLGGVLQQTYGGPGSAMGKLVGPRLSAVDPWGTVLVCDGYNDQLQTLSAEGEWREYRLGGGLKRPYDVIIVEKSMYVLWYDSKNTKISQYDIGH